MSRLLFFLFCIGIYASQIEIEALKFETDTKSGITIFEGNVTIKKNQDTMRADNVKVYTDTNKTITKFEADGNAKFIIFLDKNVTFKGSSNSFIYMPKQRLFELLGNAKIVDLKNKREIMGDRVILNEKTKSAKVIGKDKKPVKLIFQIDENESK